MATALQQTAAAAVELTGIAKGFDKTPVLQGVDFELRRGEVHALAGGNGAGKSTLMKILLGVHKPDEGTIRVNGREVSFSSIKDAESAGIGMVFQEFSLIGSLSVARNVFLGREPRRFGLIDDRGIVRETAAVLAGMGVDVDPRAELGTLPTGYWQLTEIAKALAKRATVLVMDEPTASLAKHEAEALFALIDRLKEQGVSIVYISHRMDEIARVADRITVLRDGGRVLTEPVAELSAEQIVEAIVGRRIKGALDYQPRAVAGGRVALLEASGIRAGSRVSDVSFRLHTGEVLGLAGLMGSGRTELARCLFGVDRIEAGELLLRGERLELRSPTDAIAAGIVLIPEDRRRQGLVLDHAVRENLLLPGLRNLPALRRGPFVDDRAGGAVVRDLVTRFSIKVASVHRPVRLLSGGNQQKVVLAKWLQLQPAVLVLDEPTAGVDIGTKTEIIQMIRELADTGVGVIVISSELAELLAVCDRILVLRRGAVAADLDRADIADEEALQLAVQEPAQPDADPPKLAAQGV